MARSAKPAETREERTLIFTLEMPLRFDEDEFLHRAHAAVAEVARDFGGRTAGWTMGHGTLSRAEHYAALAREALERSGKP